MLKEKRKFKELAVIVMSMISSYSLCMLLTDMERFSPLTLPMTAGAYIFVRLTRKYFRKELDEIFSKKSSPVLGAVLSLFVSVGICLNAGVDKFFGAMFGGFVSFVKTAFVFFGVAVASYWAVMTVLALMLRLTSNCNEPKKKLSFVKMFVILVVIYAVWYVCNYPGYITPDNYAQLHMLEGGGVLTNHHPVMHTLLIDLTVNIIGRGNPVVYFIVQIPIIAAVNAYTVCWIGRRTSSKAVYWLSVAFFALFPLNIIAASSMVKDFLFGAFMLLLTVSLAEVVLTGGESLKSRREQMVFVVSLLGTAFFRNNGIFVLIAIAVTVPFIIRKSRARFLSTTVAVIIVFAVTTTVVYPMLRIGKSSIVESMGVPIQQISRTVCDNGNYTEEEAAYINSIMPIEKIKEKYNPSWADPVKFDESFDSKVIANDVGRFLKTWFKLLVKNPESYLKAYFELTQMLWNPFYESGVYENFEQSTYYTNITQKKIVPVLPDLINIIISVSQYSDYTGILHPLWNPACYLILSFLLALVIKIRGKSKQIAAFVPCWSLWITLLLATPIASAGRYMYPFFNCMPVFLAIVTENKKGSCEKSTK